MIFTVTRAERELLHRVSAARGETMSDLIRRALARELDQRHEEGRTT